MVDPTDTPSAPVNGASKPDPIPAEDLAVSRRLSVYHIRWARILAAAVTAVALVGLAGGIWAYRIVQDRRFDRQLEAAVLKAKQVPYLLRLGRYKRSTLLPFIATEPVDPRPGRVESLPAEVREKAAQAAHAAMEAFSDIRAPRRHRPRLLLAQSDLAAELGQYDEALALAEKAVSKARRWRRTRALMTQAIVLLERNAAGDEATGLTILRDLVTAIKRREKQMEPDVYYNLAIHDHLRGAPGAETRRWWQAYLAHEADPSWRYVAEHYLRQTPAPAP